MGGGGGGRGGGKGGGGRVREGEEGPSVISFMGRTPERHYFLLGIAIY